MFDDQIVRLVIKQWMIILLTNFATNSYVNPAGVQNTRSPSVTSLTRICRAGLCVLEESERPNRSQTIQAMLYAAQSTAS